MKLKPKTGLSIMPTEDFWQASTPLFSSGLVEVVEWSFDMPWIGAVVPDWCAGLVKEYSDQNQLLGHGVTFSLLSARHTARQDEWLKMLERECLDRHYIQISEHFGFTEAGPFIDNAPLPVPLTKGFLQIGKHRLRQLAQAAQLPVGVENLAFAFCLKDVLDQGVFLSELLDAVDGFLLLDLHNVYCQARNFDIDPKDILRSYPLEKVQEVHISGGSWSSSASGNRKAVRRDTHDESVPPEVFDLFSLALRMCPAIRFVILERIGGTMPDTQAQIQFCLDYKHLSQLVDAIASVYAIETHRAERPMLPDDGADLSEFQDSLIKLLNRDLKPEEMLQALSTDSQFKPFYPYVNQFDIDMIAVASQLVRRWGKLK
jgi:uncharacterized protein (UPF0276 family)